MLLSFKIYIMIFIGFYADEKKIKKGVKGWILFFVLFFAKLSYNQRLKICTYVCKFS